METFDLEKAKNGAEVCRIDGAPAKILDFDYNGKIIYKFRDKFGKWEARMTDQEGNADNRIDDLFMSPNYAYATIYKNEFSQDLYSGKLCASKEEAEMQKDSTAPDMRKFCIAKIELLLEEEEGGEE